MSNRFRDIGMGDTPQKIAVAWFTLLGYMAAIVALEIVATKVDSLAISFTAKLSFIFIFFWLQAQVSKAIWWALPDYRPKDEIADTHEKKRRMKQGGMYSALICIAIYLFTSYIIDLLIESKIA